MITRNDADIELIEKWILSEYNKMKKSKKEYHSGGWYKGEGKVNLYAHDFILWLKNKTEH